MKLFSKQLEFYKRNFETRFFFIGIFYVKTCLRLLGLFLDMLFEIYALRGDFQASSVKCLIFGEKF